MNTINGLSGTANVTYPLTGTEQSTTESFADYLDEALESVEAEESIEESDAVETESDADTSASDQLNDAIKSAVEESLVNSMLQTTGGSYSSYTGLSGLGVESMLLASAAEGSINDTQIAMFMLCMMMSSSGENSDSSMMFSLMSSLLGQTTQGTSEGERETAVVNGWDFSGYGANWTGEIKDSAPPRESTTGQAVMPVSCWIPSEAAVTNLPGDRSPEALRDVIDQFSVESSARYQPRNGSTYCNIFLWDVTSALGCEIPHYVDSATGAPRSYPDVSGAWEMNANATHDWLLNAGQEYGWREISEAEAQALANAGQPVVSAWKNTSGGSGHVQIVCPSEDGGYDATRGPTVAQAGRTNTGYTYQSSIYGSSRRGSVRYFVHE